MRKLVAAGLLFAAGWGLGRYLPVHREPASVSLPSLSTPAIHGTPAAKTAPPPTARTDDLTSLLQNQAFDAAIARYSALQVQDNERAMADARTQLLAYARRLVIERRFQAAQRLLNLFLVNAYRDVAARSLLAEVLHGRGDNGAAIDQLYTARGYAYRPEQLQHLTEQIRTLVTEQIQTLGRRQDHAALLALYQHLTQLEPDYAPYFIGLAAAQLALDDHPAARRSLLLVVQDPAVGAQAQAMLDKLEPDDVAAPEPAAPPPVAAGIPLHRSGNHFIVDAKPGRGGRVRLLIDTGATLTILTPDVLSRRDIRYHDTGRTTVFNTANGPVRAPVYRLDSLRVGDWRVDQLDVGALPLNDAGAIDGLLGMNFLSKFQFFIDQNEAVLRLSVD